MVNGVALDTVSLDDVLYADAAEVAEALNMECAIKDGAAELTGMVQYSFAADECNAVIAGETQLLNRAPFLQEDIFYLPLEDAARVMGCASYTDSESGQLYLTPGAGDWEIPQDKKIPILMYHAVSDDMWGIPELFVSPSEMEKQLAYLVENGYDPITFEDIQYIDQYDKPVILTFDDGYDDNYLELFPLLQKYNAKATVFVIANAFEMNHKLNKEQVREMSDSGLVSIQSHGMTHHDMNVMGEEELHYELGESKRILTEVTGKEVFVLCYPTGKYSDLTLEIGREYYKFGTKMNGKLCNTSEDPMLMNRYYVSRYTTLDEFAAMLQDAEEE
ncbi:MAG: polysaccharide deacetylase family protein [Ruminococcaceae bacterium]|nr:polysaccharide deacetylase family protein [Oscillospiraceae bacterium]